MDLTQVEEISKSQHHPKTWKWRHIHKYLDAYCWMWSTGRCSNLDSCDKICIRRSAEWRWRNNLSKKWSISIPQQKRMQLQCLPLPSIDQHQGRSCCSKAADWQTRRNRGIHHSVAAQSTGSFCRGPCAESWICRTLFRRRAEAVSGSFEGVWLSGGLSVHGVQ